MPEPFYSAYRKLAWGKKRIAELEWETRDFMSEHPCESFTEPHSDKPGYTIQKIRQLVPVPSAISLIASDALDNIRAVLDHALFTLAVASGRSQIENATFPISPRSDVAKFENMLKGRCADVPQEIWPLLRSFKPYKGGNDTLIALNDACNRNKHALIVSLVPDFPVIEHRSFGTEMEGIFTAPKHPVWDRAKNEMELFTVGPEVQLIAEFKLTFLVVFAEIAGFERQQIFSVLGIFAAEVERILRTIEVHARILGLVK
jgi:hypothetical protein